jgi:hypothetical protein
MSAFAIVCVVLAAACFLRAVWLLLIAPRLWWLRFQNRLSSSDTGANR